MHYKLLMFLINCLKITLSADAFKVSVFYIDWNGTKDAPAALNYTPGRLFSSLKRIRNHVQGKQAHTGWIWKVTFMARVELVSVPMLIKSAPASA